jgi:hypothetical protein
MKSKDFTLMKDRRIEAGAMETTFFNPKEHFSKNLDL